MFPSLVGGTITETDFAPSLVAIALYLLVFIVSAYRLSKPLSRNIMLLTTTMTALDRMALFTVRTVQSRSTKRAASQSIAKYMQAALGVAFLSIAFSVCTLNLTVLTATTRDGTKGGVSRVDQPNRRFWYRRSYDAVAMLFLVGLVIGIVAGTEYPKSITSTGEASLVTSLRYASAIIGAIMYLYCILSQLLVLATVRGVSARPSLIIIGVSSLVCIQIAYRLSIFHLKTDSLLARGTPGSLSSPAAKALFYLLHVLSEWASQAILVSINIRKLFKTGFMDMWIWREPPVVDSRLAVSGEGGTTDPRSKESEDLKV